MGAWDHRNIRSGVCLLFKYVQRCLSVRTVRDTEGIFHGPKFVSPAVLDDVMDVAVELAKCWSDQDLVFTSHTW